MREYNLVNTLGGPYGFRPITGESGNGSTLLSKGRNPARYLLPVRGVPMKAKDTLLAQCLKAGVAPDEINSDTWDVAIRSKRYNTTLGHKPAKAGVDPKRRPQLIGKLLGIEIEYYPCSLCRLRDYRSPLAHLGTDGSLREGGAEFRKITWASQDADGTLRLNGIRSLPIKGKVDPTCGLHVHVDVRHLNPSDPYYRSGSHLSLAETYDRLLSISKFIRRLVPQHRRNSDWCLWESNLDSECGSRYHAFNAKSIKEHGSLEWRMQAGSTNTLLIENWALLCYHWTNRMAKAGRAPSSWGDFLSDTPEPLRSWCILRFAKLYPPCSIRPSLNERSQAIEN